MPIDELSQRLGEAARERGAALLRSGPPWSATRFAAPAGSGRVAIAWLPPAVSPALIFALLAGDVAALAQHFIGRFSREMGKDVAHLDPEALRVLERHAFPGNVRELENVIERAVALSREPVIQMESLPPALLNPASPSRQSRIPPEGVTLDQLLEDYERSLLTEALGPAGGVKKRAAQLLGISFRSFRYRIEKLGLDDSNTGDS